MLKEPTPPSTNLNAFDCPHCGAYADQTWFDGYGEAIYAGKRLPKFKNEINRHVDLGRKDLSDDDKTRLTRFYEVVLMGEVMPSGEERRAHQFANLSISVCRHCSKSALWTRERMVHPQARVGVVPNQDLPADLIADFEEARSIAMTSPRGAAALMRLIIQKLCKELGEKGKNIDDDIASLVAKGLDPLIQQALDFVRVVGNSAVHPGSINLKDDYDTAITLFGLVNAIADQMISHPKKVKALYAGLPAKNLAAIAARDAPPPPKSGP